MFPVFVKGKERKVKKGGRRREGKEKERGKRKGEGGKGKGG